jgi:cytochrome o ubiquinol oxidase subunit 2
MRLKKYRLALSLALFAMAIITSAVWYLHGRDIAVLHPEGAIGIKERNLMVFTVMLGFLVVIPVFIMAIAITWRYREGNTKAKYSPEWDKHRLAEFSWWAIPIAIITVLSVVTWQSTFALDPYKALVYSNKPLTIQVVALDWKWLFIYPQQKIASVNFAVIPENTPVHFDITADAPMNSFWIPKLGGQIYAMPGMSTQLNLIANNQGVYNGSSANISGEGFAGMNFTVKASSQTDFNEWVQQAKSSSQHLNYDTYRLLIQPSKNNPPAVYSNSRSDLYNLIIEKYTMPINAKSEINNMRSY